MANELTISAGLKFVKGNKSVSFGKSGIQLDVAGDDLTWQTQNVGTSEEALNLGDVTTPGYILIYNEDATNYMSVRSGTGADNLVKVRPNAIALFECEASAPYVIANTAGVRIHYCLIEA